MSAHLLAESVTSGLILADRDAQPPPSRPLRHPPLSMARTQVFVSSPGDVHEEREVVRRVADQVNARLPEGAPPLVPHFWEDLTAPGAGRPQDLVSASTRLADTAVFIGILWSRLGTPTGRVTDDGVPLTGTVEEIETALALHAAGKLKHVLLYFCDRSVQRGQWASAAQVEEYRLRLEGSQRALTARYGSVEDFEAQLFRHLNDVARTFAAEDAPAGPAPSGSAAASAPAEDGELLPLLCDRRDQELDFFRSFVGFASTPPSVRVCVIYGDEGHCHTSLVERLVKTYVEALAETVAGSTATRGRLMRRAVTWPQHRGRDPEALKERLATSVARDIRQMWETVPATCRELLQADPVRANAFLVISHQIELEGWDDVHKALVDWYVGTYWDDVPDAAPYPHVVVFLKIVCSGRMAEPTLWDRLHGRPAAKERMRADLDALMSRKGTRNRRLLLDELEPVEPRHVNDWFEEHRPRWSDADRARFVARIFGASKRRLMRDVEPGLCDVPTVPPPP